MAPTRDDLDAKAVARALSDDATLATVLHAICLTHYGDEVYEHDPIEIFTRLEEDFGLQLTELNENKINACITLITSEAFTQSPQAFQAICNTFNHGDPGLELLEDPLTVPEAFWGVYEAELQRDLHPFTPAVQSLIAQTISQEWSDDDQEEEGWDYVKNYLHERRSELRQQLEALGYEASHLPPIKARLPDSPLK